jgi:hypothetical protein
VRQQGRIPGKGRQRQLGRRGGEGKHSAGFGNMLHSAAIQLAGEARAGEAAASSPRRLPALQLPLPASPQPPPVPPPTVSLFHPTTAFVSRLFSQNTSKCSRSYSSRAVSAMTGEARCSPWSYTSRDQYSILMAVCAGWVGGWVGGRSWKQCSIDAGKPRAGAGEQGAGTPGRRWWLHCAVQYSVLMAV